MSTIASNHSVGAKPHRLKAGEVEQAEMHLFFTAGDSGALCRRRRTLGGLGPPAFATSLAADRHWRLVLHLITSHF